MQLQTNTRTQLVIAVTVTADTICIAVLVISTRKQIFLKLVVQSQLVNLTHLHTNICTSMYIVFC